MNLEQLKYLWTHLQQEQETMTQFGDENIDWEHFHMLTDIIYALEMEIEDLTKNQYDLDVSDFHYENFIVIRNNQKLSDSGVHPPVAYIQGKTIEEAKHKAKRYIDEILLTEK